MEQEGERPVRPDAPGARFAGTEQAAALVSLVESTPDFVAITQLDGMIDYINPAGRELIGLDADADVRGIPAITLYGSQGCPLRSEELDASGQNAWNGHATLLNRRDGTDIPTLARLFVIPDPNTGATLGIGTVQHDSRELLAAAQREVVAAEQAARRRIAQEVHEDALQLLTAAQLRMQLVINDLPAEGATAKAADLVADLLSQAQRRLRSLLTSEADPGASADGAVAPRR